MLLVISISCVIWPAGKNSSGPFGALSVKGRSSNICDEGISAQSLKGRPAALAALEVVRSGKAAGPLVAKMDRLSRSVVDGAGFDRAGRPRRLGVAFRRPRHRYEHSGPRDGGQHHHRWDAAT